VCSWALIGRIVFSCNLGIVPVWTTPRSLLLRGAALFFLTSNDGLDAYGTVEGTDPVRCVLVVNRVWGQ
jgi:hypothetical protein